ncbi:MAG: HAD superfamily hydrolase (TIGR01509 family) [Verrucomicrobiales bacterium]|jgi:HAD superfamily hydrolase (TIGR01509 family)
MIRGLIFYFDGLILDTEMPIYTAWRECYADHGHDLLIETYQQCIGTDFADYNPHTELEQLTGRSLDEDELGVIRRSRIAELLEDAAPMPGIESLLAQARQAEIGCAVASSSSKDWVPSWLERLELAEYFQHVVTVDLVQRPKPSPELFQLAAARLGLDPDEVLILEDSLNGLRAAQTAGMRCLVVPCDVTRTIEFEGATHRVESLAEMSLQQLLAL